MIYREFIFEDVEERDLEERFGLILFFLDKIKGFDIFSIRREIISYVSLLIILYT